MYCAISRLSSPAHNVPSSWNTLSPLLLLANAHSLISAKLDDAASWKASLSAPPPPHPRLPVRTLSLRIYSTKLIIKIVNNAYMVPGTYYAPGIVKYIILTEIIGVSISLVQLCIQKHSLSTSQLVPPEKDK